MSEEKTLEEWFNDGEFRAMVRFIAGRSLLPSMFFTALFYPIVESETLFLIFLTCLGMWKLGAVNMLIWKNRNDLK